jgi:hypothetical protein
VSGNAYRDKRVGLKESPGAYVERQRSLGEKKMLDGNKISVQTRKLCPLEIRETRLIEKRIGQM